MQVRAVGGRPVAGIARVVGGFNTLIPGVAAVDRGGNVAARRRNLALLKEVWVGSSSSRGFESCSANGCVGTPAVEPPRRPPRQAAQARLLHYVTALRVTIDLGAGAASFTSRRLACGCRMRASSSTRLHGPRELGYGGSRRGSNGRSNGDWLPGRPESVLSTQRECEATLVFFGMASEHDLQRRLGNGDVPLAENTGDGDYLDVFGAGGGGGPVQRPRGGQCRHGCAGGGRG